MAYEKPTQLTAWSFSRWNDYEKCAAFAKYKYLDKLGKGTSNAAMERGAKVHDQARDYLIKPGRQKMPTEMSLHFEEFVRTLRQRRQRKPAEVIVEETWALKRDWTQTTWNDWAGCWLRVKVDAADFITPELLEPIDWKTGKFDLHRNQDYVLQLEIYATVALALFPKLLTVRPKLVYLDNGHVYPTPDAPLEYQRKDLPALKRTWEKRTKKMLTDKTFKPVPSSFCSWCEFSKGNGGPCQY